MTLPVGRRRRVIWRQCLAALLTGLYTDELSTRFVDMVGICPAPLPRGGARCGVLFLRRGRAKLYCSDTCRARVASRRARRHL